MGRWRDSWAARNLSVRLAWPMPQTRLPLWFRATGSSALMEVLPDTAAASAGSAGCSLTRGSLWRSLPRDVFQKRHESHGSLTPGTESLQTHRWREMDSNFQFLDLGQAFYTAPEFGAANALSL